MLHVDIPTAAELKALITARSDAAVSLYVPTSAETQHADAGRIVLGNLLKDALAQLEAAGLDKRRREALAEHVEEIAGDEDFWRMQARSLAVLADPDRARTYRLPTHLPQIVEVSDRFHLKPLFRAVAFPHHAFVLAVEENGARLVEIFSDMAPEEIQVPHMPKDAASAVGRRTVSDRSETGRVYQGGERVLLRQYARQIDAALRPVLAGRHEPVILAAAEPMASVYRNVTALHHVAAEGLETSPARMTPAELAEAATPVLDRIHAAALADFADAYEARAGQGRSTDDVATAARAATMGAVDTLLVDMDHVLPGAVDETTGAVTFAEADGADAYGVVDEIAGRAILTGAHVLAVRQADIPGGGALAATLRYPV